MSCPSKKEAENILNKIIDVRNATQYPFSEKAEIAFRAHSRDVGMVAEIFAKKTKYLNHEKAYVLGLLHDCGYILDEKKEHIFHGVVGYHYMMSLGYDEVAKVCLTHSFYTENFRDEDYPHLQDFIPECRKIMENFSFDDYDKLISLCNMMNNAGKICSIDSRIQSVSAEYQIPLKQLNNIKKDLYEIKSFFDEKCQNDIYNFLAIK